MKSKEMELQINADERRLNTLSEEIIGAAFGVGFLEKVYENALNIELKNIEVDMDTAELLQKGARKKGVSISRLANEIIQKQLVEANQ